jgi:hypothetical protein
MVGTEKTSIAYVEKRLSKIGKTFGYGWFTGRDGETHLGVDEEELLAGYRFGVDFKKSREPWTQDWSLY